MAFWLLKTEPTCYAWDDMLRDRKTVWDGITNALALKHLRSMAKGDLALFYHTGGERSAVGVVEVTREAYPDPNGDGDPKRLVVDVKYKRALARPVSLDEIKADPAFKGFDLLRISRLSVVPVPEPMWKRIETLARP